MKIDTTGMSPEELRETLAQLQRENDKRDAKNQALKQMDHALMDRLQAEGIGPGRKWVDPKGDVSEAYPRRWVVRHEGRYYASRKHVNTDTPGETDAWEYVDPNSKSRQSEHGEPEGDEAEPEPEKPRSVDLATVQSRYQEDQ